MKTLVLQLARLGDIYQTWPVMRALARTAAHGEEFHLLVRDRFKGAADGLGEVARLWTLQTQDHLAPLLADRVDVEGAEESLASWINSLKAEGFTRIINLTFSPFSSRLVYELASPGVEVRGYSRHADGFFNALDDASAYFYAQVGPQRDNRVHLTDLFALVAGVDLTAQDWLTAPAWPEVAPEGNRDPAVKAVLASAVRPILLHVGSSQVEKSYGTYKWNQVAKGLVEATDTPVVLIGSTDETVIAQTISAVSSSRKPIDLTGKTSLRDLYELLNWAALVIGADSAPIHVAALTQTPVLNLSFNSVNFWETGPKSPRSRILAFASPQDLPSDLVVREALNLLEERPGDSRAVLVADHLKPYIAPADVASSPGWEWLQAIYMGRPFPVPENELCVQGLIRLYEANSLALDQLVTLTNRPEDRTAILILQRFDEIVETIAALSPSVGLLVRWFQTERIRIGPMDAREVLTRTLGLHTKLQEILHLYNSAPPALEANDRSEGYDDCLVG